MIIDGQQVTENDVMCGCRWDREPGGRLGFRECSLHYIARVFPPEVT